MKFLFCENVLKPNTVDDAFIEEYENVLNNGFNVLLLNSDNKLLGKIQTNDKIEEIIYRGWMLTPAEYSKLYYDLLSNNYKLINNPTEYQNCHYLPDSLKFIENYTPKTIFQKIENNNSINNLLNYAKIFNGKAVIVKDYVKSEKHYWDTACYVENSSNLEKLKETIENLIELRENHLNEGIVIREYVELNKLKNHSKSNMPISEEYRMFFYKNELLCIFNYWEEGDYNIEKPKTEEFENIAKNIESNFFTMDIAKNKKGKYIIIELGDGQVAGIPDNVEKNIMYMNIKKGKPAHNTR